ncbi:MAG: hypothetical protein ACK42I_02195, partial [Thermomicrobium sp.]
AGGVVRVIIPKLPSELYSVNYSRSGNSVLARSAPGECRIEPFVPQRAERQWAPSQTLAPCPDI